MEAVAASVEDLIMRIERLERWLGPRSFATAALREQRRELIAQARARGLSIQGIARAFGLSPRTVESVVKQLPEPEFVRGLDGRRYAPRRNGARPQP